MLRDVRQRDLSGELFGARIDGPGARGTRGVQSIVHPDGELATATAAADCGVPVILSSVSSVCLEDVAEAMGEAPRWFQLYWPKDPELTRVSCRGPRRPGTAPSSSRSTTLSGMENA